MERILIVDDEAFIRENLARILAEDGYQPVTCADGNEAVRIAAQQDVDLVLLDLNLGKDSGLDVLRSLRDNDPEVLVIIITGYGTVESAVDALKLGAYDYIKKPFKADAIRLIVKLALETQHLRREVRQLRRVGEEHGFGGAVAMVGESPPMRQVYRQIHDVAKHDATVLITGESGTGKELVARGIHELSLRRKRPFIEINCGSLPINLLESELFGHERGAFTDARSRKIGLFEEAAGGTIFLDEIGEMDLTLQVKLLRVLEERKFRRVGGTHAIDSDVRVLAATNRNLRQAIDDKRFRDDLYYRLNVFPIHIPPLRERRGDIPVLLDFFLRRYNRDFNKGLREISRPALDRLIGYDWPGNVRELRNIVERICIMCDGPRIEPELLPREILGDQGGTKTAPVIDFPPQGVDLQALLDGYESSIVAQAVRLGEGNIAKTARLLNLPRGTLRYKLEKYRIDCEQ